MVPVMYRLGAAVGGVLAGRTAALLWALPPSPLVVWSAMARGGFIEVVWLGAVATLLTLRWLQSERPRASQLFLIGAVLGFGWWVNNQVVYFLAPIAALIFARLLGERGGYLGAAIASAMKFGVGFLLGSVPFWIYNVTHSFASFGILNRANIADIPEHLAGLFSTALPMLLGARRFWHNEDVFPAASVAVLLVYCLLLAAVLALRGRELRGLLSMRVDRKAPVELFVLILFTALGAFTFSSFGHLVTAPRYLLPIYVPIFVLVGYLVAMSHRAVPVISRAITPLLLAVALSSCYLGGRAIPGQPFVAKQQRVAADHTELITWLKERQIGFIKTNYWIGYRLAFETQEQVKFIRFQEPLDTRIPEYTEEGEKIQFEQVPYVLVPAQAETAREALRALGYTFSESTPSGYVVIHDMVSKGDGARIVPPEGLKAVTNAKTQETATAIDKDLKTRWGSGEPQNPSLWFEVSAVKPRMLRGFSLDMTGWESDFARGLSVVGTTPAGATAPLLSEDQYRAIRWLLPDAGRQFRVNFEPQSLTKLRFMQTGQDPIFDWSIAELTLWE
jgi:hypothetical protein